MFRLTPRPRAAVLAAALVLLLPGLAAGAAMTKLISLDADNADIPAVLKTLAERGELNIITGPGVSGGRISIHIKDVPVDQAVNLIVRAAGLAYERIGNSILVADAASLDKETGLSTYIVDLKYADASEMKAALADLCQEIQVDAGGNRLIVKTSPRIISEIGEVVRVMDAPVQQVMLEARIVEVGTEDLQELGIDWDRLSRQTAIIVEGPTPNPTAPDLVPEEVGWLPFSSDATFGPWSRQAGVFEVALDLLIREGKARVVATPRIATLNGKEAYMLIGRRVPYQTTGTTFAGGGAATTVQVEKEEVGVKLRITPLINADGYITTTISPEVSSIVGFVGIGNDLPIVATRQATTTVRLKDGNSVIIGGLLQEDEVVNITKVPLLGDIPFLGLLFQHRNVQISKRDLVIEVTPRILPDQK